MLDPYVMGGVLGTARATSPGARIGSRTSTKLPPLGATVANCPLLEDEASMSANRGILLSRTYPSVLPTAVPTLPSYMSIITGFWSAMTGLESGAMASTEGDSTG